MPEKTSKCARTNRYFNQPVAKEPNCKQSGLYKHEPVTEPAAIQNTCTKSAYQRATVNVPVAVKPFALAGSTKTYCCSDPVIKGIRCNQYHNEEICYFTFSQEICVEVPIHFGAKACVGDSWVDCHGASTEECIDCDTE